MQNQELIEQQFKIQEPIAVYTLLHQLAMGIALYS